MLGVRGGVGQGGVMCGGGDAGGIAPLRKLQSRTNKMVGKRLHANSSGILIAFKSWSSIDVKEVVTAYSNATVYTHVQHA